MDLRGRGLLAHEAEGYEEWGVSGSVAVDPGGDRLGLSLNVRPAWGECGEPDVEGYGTGAER